MPPIRVLIVDDSMVIRSVLSELLQSDPAIEIAGTASNGKVARSLIPQVKPDLVKLDFEMPGWMDSRLSPESAVSVPNFQ